MNSSPVFILRKSPLLGIVILVDVISAPVLSTVCFIASGGIYHPEKGIQTCSALVAKHDGRGAGMNIAVYTAKKMKTVPDGHRLREDVHQGRYLRS